MAKKDTDNFDFEVEGEGKEKGKINLNLDFIKNLTKQQKGIILAALVGIILVVAIVVICVVLGTAGSNNSGGTNGGGNNGGSETGGENGRQEYTGELPTDVYGFAISASPTKTSYYVGEEPDYSGMLFYMRSNTYGSIIVNYEDNPDAFVITGFDNSVAVEQQIITVTFGEYSSTFTVEIKERPVVAPRLVSISFDIANMPADTCKKDSAPKLNGAKLICEYSDGSTKVINLEYDHLYGSKDKIKAAKVGDVVTLDVIYEENGYVAETSYTVTIVE